MKRQCKLAPNDESPILLVLRNKVKAQLFYDRISLIYKGKHFWKWPRYIDCRPIYVERSVTRAGYTVKDKISTRMTGLPLEIVLATKT